VHVVYQDGRGILRQLLEKCDVHHWHLTSLVTDPPGLHQSRSIAVAMPGEVGIMMTLAGSRVVEAARVLAEVEGVARIDELHDDSD
jgi:putative Mg2+ transporter-C (MgtC) family protein